MKEMGKFTRIAILSLFASFSAAAQQPKRDASMTPVLELFGGYSHIRLTTPGYGSAENGILCSVGWNVKPWLQFVADSGYNRAAAGSKGNKLYGNHYGARLFYLAPNKWGITPFGEVLLGGSRTKVTLGSNPALHFSDNGFSLRVGGGLDININRRLAIRVFDADYYRTPFFNSHQQNFLISSGIVLQFGGGRSRATR